MSVGGRQLTFREHLGGCVGCDGYWVLSTMAASGQPLAAWDVVVGATGSGVWVLSSTW